MPQSKSASAIVTGLEFGTSEPTEAVVADVAASLVGAATPASVVDAEEEDEPDTASLASEALVGVLVLDAVKAVAGPATGEGDAALSGAFDPELSLFLLANPVVSRYMHSRRSARIT